MALRASRISRLPLCLALSFSLSLLLFCSVVLIFCFPAILPAVPAACLLPHGSHTSVRPERGITVCVCFLPLSRPGPGLAYHPRCSFCDRFGGRGEREGHGACWRRHSFFRSLCSLMCPPGSCLPQLSFSRGLNNSIKTKGYLRMTPELPRSGPRLRNTV